MTRTAESTRTLTTTEAAVLALLAIEGERSGYDLLKLCDKAIGHVWSPAKSQLYAVLPRLVESGLARGRAVAQARRPDKQVYRITPTGRAALDGWLETVEPGAVDGFYLKLFVGGLTTHDVLRRHVEQFRDDMRRKLVQLEAIEPTNTRTGNDWYHGFLLDLGLRRTRQAIRWADEVLRAL
jgi:DNA-binding PadR family transcriptional regulator